LKMSLTSVLILISFSFIQKIIQLNKKEIIVYNNPDNMIIHFINGKQNYIVSDKVIEANEFSHTIIRNNVTKSNLNNPVYLTIGDTFRDSHLFIKEGMIHFEGKVISIHQNSNGFPMGITPNFVIDPPNNEMITNANNNEKQIIITAQNNRKNWINFNTIYSVQKQGAFRKKW